MTATRTFEYQHVIVDESCNVAAFYSRKNNSFTVNHKLNNPQFNKESHDIPTACHEMKHKDNQLEGIQAYALSPEQAYKVKMHDEISANIAALISLREEYLKTGDINVFDAEPRFKFYKEAILNGEINPKSKYKEDFDKEMSLIANGTKDMWMKKCANSYLESNSTNAAYLCELDNKHAAYYDQNYARAKKVAYGNIGGVDFSQYMKEDVEIPPKGKELLDQKVAQVRKQGRKEFYSVNADIIDADYFEREDEDIEYKAYNTAVKNEPINPINTKPPRYPKGAKIEQKQIPDLRQKIIKQPTAYHTRPNQSNAVSGVMHADSGKISRLLNALGKQKPKPNPLDKVLTEIRKRSNQNN